MLRLYAGRENIDKERFIYDRVRERGGETLVLVPDQYTLVAEEQALRYLDTDCLFDVEILSMNRLGLRILTEQGTESVRMLDKYGRFMLLSMLIREHMDDFEIFRRPAGRLSFTSMLNDFISDFKQQNCSIEDLQELLAGSSGDSVLAAKLRELGGVISAYEEAIKDRFTDSEDYISMYVEAIKDSELIRGKSIWIYGYDSITPKFAGAMIELAQRAESVNFILNRSDFGLDGMLISSLKELSEESNTGFSVEEIGPGYAVPATETVRRIERSLWKDVLSDAETEENRDFVPEDLTMVCAANPYSEAESAAVYIWHLVRDLGYRMRDIQVIANDEGMMQPVIRRVFAEYGLPVFADTARSITDSAAVGFIVNLLGFIRSRGVTQYLFAMLKTGLSDYDDGDIEELENYARNYRIRGSMWNRPFRYGAGELGEEKFSKLERMRKELSERTDALAVASKKAGSVSAFTSALRSCLDEVWQLGDRVAEAASAREEAGLFDEAQRLTQSYEMALEIFAQMDEIMGDSALDIGEFTDIYTAGLSDVEVGVIPPTRDGLSMGTMIRTRPGRVRAAVILGANEGTMPLSPSTEGLFSTDEKDLFREKGFALGRLDDLRINEESAAMYRMLARPSEKIYISWSMSDAEGGDASPGEIIGKLKGLFPRIDADGLVKRDVISEGFGTDVIQREGDAMRHLIKHIKDGNASGGPRADSDSAARALIRWYADNRKDELDTMLRAAAYDNAPEPLGRAAAKELFGRSDGSLVLSASSISAYVDCPFRFYVDRGLKPVEEREFSSDARSVGDVYHECLMAVARQLMGDRGLLDRLKEEGGRADGGAHEGSPEGDEDILEKLVSDAIDEISSDYRGGLFISAGSEEYRMSRIREICAAAAKAMAGQLRAETVLDSRFEERFGRRAEFEPIRLKVGDDEVYVEGRIDRADYMDVGGEKRIRIIDYKTGSDRLDLWKVRQGVKMQLMIYLISASGGGLQPAGMFYFNISDPIDSANDKSAGQISSMLEKAPEDEFRLKGAYINEEGVLEAMPAGVLSSAKGGISREEYEQARSDVLARIEEAATGILSGRIGINPLKNDNRLVCSRCGYRPVCRRDRSYVKNYARTIKPKPAKDETQEPG